jgi:hypothetical protein
MPAPIRALILLQLTSIKHLGNDTTLPGFIALLPAEPVLCSRQLLPYFSKFRLNLQGLKEYGFGVMVIPKW